MWNKEYFEIKKPGSKWAQYVVFEFDSLWRPNLAYGFGGADIDLKFGIRDNGLMKKKLAKDTILTILYSATEDFKGIGKIFKGINKEEPLYDKNFKYLTSVWGRFPTTITMKRDTFDDSFDIGDTLEYGYENLSGAEIIRVVGEGKGMIYGNGSGIGEFNNFSETSPGHMG